MPLSFFPHYSLSNINDRILLLSEYASGVYTSMNSDAYTFLSISTKLNKEFKDGNLWQQWLIKALCRVNRTGNGGRLK